VSTVTRLTEPILRIPRAARTVAAVGRFDSSYASQATTDGDENWRMRSAMDIHPQAGRLISRLGVRKSRGGVPGQELAGTSSFVDLDEIDRSVQGLRDDGVYVFDKKLPAAMVEAMRNSALEAPSIARGVETSPAPFPRHDPQVGRYDIDEDNTMASPEMQDFCSDPAMALIASKYLGQPVIQDQTALWWTTTQGSADAALNAWLFHQDRDRLSFLKFFVYLTDVGPNNGPHTYVKGTQKRVPRSLASDGRKDDNLVRRAGLWDRVISLTGEAGTMMAVDTVGLHKGQPPVEGDRCVLQVEFATSLFGALPDYPVFTPSELSRQRYAAMPEILQRWNRAFTNE
jgi:hypothetical protein